MWFVIPESSVETVFETTQNERRELRKRSELQWAAQAAQLGDVHQYSVPNDVGSSDAKRC